MATRKDPKAVVKKVKGAVKAVGKALKPLTYKPSKVDEKGALRRAFEPHAFVMRRETLKRKANVERAKPENQRRAKTWLGANIKSAAEGGYKKGKSPLQKASKKLGSLRRPIGRVNPKNK